MTKIEVISQKPSKNWIFGKNDHFWRFFGRKNPPFWIFPRVPLLTHASRHLGEDFRKFSAKSNDKNWSYKSKTFKKLDFWQKWLFFDSFWSKMGKKWIFFKNPLGTFFFTFPKPYLTAKFQKNLMNGCLDMSVTHSHTYIHTYKGQLIGLPAARQKYTGTRPIKKDTY